MGNTLSLLRSADFNIINLETTLTESTDKVDKVFNFKADPDKVNVLTEGSIDLVNLANNHILDFSYQGLRETIETLSEHNIKHVGAGLSQQEAKKPVIITENNIKIGIIGYTDNEPSWKATDDKPGTNYVSITPQGLKSIESEVKKLASQVDICIVSIHWGPNKVEVPSQEIQDFAHKLVDLGVDIIHGHSAHLIQGIEKYKNSVILYSTGDFIDDYAPYEDARNDLSFYYQVVCSNNKDKKVKKVYLYPVKIDYGQTNRATGSDFNYIADKVISLSKNFDTNISKHNTYLSFSV